MFAVALAGLMGFALGILVAEWTARAWPLWLWPSWLWFGREYGAVYGGVFGVVFVGAFVCVFGACLLLVGRFSRKRTGNSHTEEEGYLANVVQAVSVHIPEQLLVMFCLFAMLFGIVRSNLLYTANIKFAQQQAEQYVQIRGQVVSHLSTYRIGDTQFVTAIVNVLDQPSLGYMGLIRIAISGPQASLEKRSIITVSGYLNRPDQAFNPGGFDGRAWLWRQAILLQMKPNPAAINVLTPGDLNIIEKMASDLRITIAKDLARLVGPERSPLLLALLIGETTELVDSTAYFFRQAGLSHLMAVSGANIAFWLIPLTSLLRKMNMRRGIRQMMLLLALAGFGFLTGWQASVTRAIVMSAVMLGAR
ncbi:MAG: ComEC/Rec2 family competence protein, partial [Eubacteriales bacterium]|nr:ComEC/Rec2 family competence protein [Eubacteriales bacterium]